MYLRDLGYVFRVLFFKPEIIRKIFFSLCNLTNLTVFNVNVFQTIILFRQYEWSIDVVQLFQYYIKCLMCIRKNDDFHTIV